MESDNLSREFEREQERNASVEGQKWKSFVRIRINLEENFVMNKKLLTTLVDTLSLLEVKQRNLFIYLSTLFFLERKLIFFPMKNEVNQGSNFFFFTKWNSNELQTEAEFREFPKKQFLNSWWRDILFPLERNVFISS